MSHTPESSSSACGRAGLASYREDEWWLRLPVPHGQRCDAQLERVAVRLSSPSRLVAAVHVETSDCAYFVGANSGEITFRAALNELVAQDSREGSWALEQCVAGTVLSEGRMGRYGRRPGAAGGRRARHRGG